MSKTTIQLDESTKDRLEELKRVDGESYESVLLMLIAHYNNTDDGLLTESQRGEVREIALDVVNQRVRMEALE